MATPPESDPSQTTPASPDDVNALLGAIAGIGQTIKETFASPGPEVVLDGFQSTDLDVGDYSYDPQEIATAARFLLNTCGDISTVLARHGEQALTHAEGWKGMSKDAFVTRLQAIGENIRLTADWLTDAATHLVNLAEDVQQQDQVDAGTLNV